jgi:membrane-associated phospholipid phosphatase
MARRPLLARRGLAVLFVVLAVLGTAALGVRYAHTRTPGRFDRHLDATIQRHVDGHPHLVVRVVDLADPGSIIVICALLCAFFLLLNRTRLAVLAVLGPALAGGLVDLVLKPLFDRHLETMLSFPSGHTAATASLALVVIFAMLGPGRLPWPPALRCLIALAATASVPVIAIALIGGGYHYATDTIGGLLVAIACVFSVALVIDTMAGQPGSHRAAPKRAAFNQAIRPDDAMRPKVRA